jgi:hypothetical protein
MIPEDPASSQRLIALQDFRTANDRIGSFASISDVLAVGPALGQERRFRVVPPRSALTPIATEQQTLRIGSLVPGATYGMQQTWSLFDHLVGARE